MGGKSSPPPPDYTPVANASRESAEIMAGLGREQLAFARQQYDEIAPVARRIAESQIGTQEALTRMAEEDRDYSMQTFRPVEQALVRRAQEFDTEAYREQMASQAAADAARAFGNMQAQTTRGLGRLGVAPNSGAMQSQLNTNSLAAASQRAGAMTGARQQAEQLGYARMLDASGLGRNLPGLSQSAYGAAVGAGSAGLSSAQAPGIQYSQGLAAGVNTIGAGRSMLQSGLGSILSTQGNLYAAGMNQPDPIMGLIGTGIGAYGALRPSSDRRLKEDIERVGRDERTGLNLYLFSYIDDPEKRRFMGVMADEVLDYMPEAVSRDANGFMRVDYKMLGIEMLEV
jgi:hypothetical protein